jgi:hypothetical protein
MAEFEASHSEKFDTNGMHMYQNAFISSEHLNVSNDKKDKNIISLLA